LGSTNNAMFESGSLDRMTCIREIAAAWFALQDLICWQPGIVWLGSSAVLTASGIARS
jgi:hypothetical protein